MTAYSKSINFTALAGSDALASIFDTEFNLVATAVNSKANTASPTFTGTVVVPALAAIVSHTGDATKTSPIMSSEVYMHTFPTNTKAVFYQATAPTGWTQLTAAGLNDALLRIVTGSGGVTGGTTGFIASPLNITGSHTLTVSQMPAHTHTYTHVGGSGSQQFISGAGVAVGTAATTGSKGGGTGHTHPISWSPKYADFIVCKKD